MTVTLQSTKDTGRVHCTGVVVACHGDRHDGYAVRERVARTAVVERQAARLNLLAFS